jgi:O-antigen biosynthesis protein WbqP
LTDFTTSSVFVQNIGQLPVVNIGFLPLDKRENKLVKRIFDISIVIFSIPILALPMIFICILVLLSSKGPILYWSKRIGLHQSSFQMPKFRSMRMDAPVVASHLLTDPQSFLTPIGSFLRQSSLDELPQLWSILKGDMSFVGPRPALFNQEDLIAMREDNGIHQLLPGLTGWAQVNGRDDLPLQIKVNLDREYLLQKSIFFDIQIMGLTCLKVLRRNGVSH